MKTRHSQSRPAVLGGSLLLLILFLSGCVTTTVEHASTLKRLQDDYNSATERANREALHFAGLDETGTLQDGNLQGNDGNPRVGIGIPEVYNDLWLDYSAIAAEARQLNAGSRDALLRDQLYVNSLVLELLARKQKALYEGMMLSVEGPKNDSDEEDQAGYETPADIANLLKRTKTELADLDGAAPIHPRNYFVLQAMEPLVKYDNALILAIRAYYNGSFAARDMPAVKPLVEQIAEAARLLEGRKVHENAELWIFTSRAVKATAMASGYDRILREAGAKLMTDTCSAISQAVPKGTKVAAFDSAKQTHYLPAMMGIEGWYGTTSECIDAACTGKWQGRLN